MIKHFTAMAFVARGDATLLLFEHDAALAVKVSIPRPTIQGALEDTDCYGGQQYALVLDALEESTKS